MVQPAPRQAGQDVEAEVLVDKRREYDQPIVVTERGEPLAHRQRRWAPAHGEGLAVDGNRVITPPPRRMNPDDPGVGPTLAEPLHLPGQVLGSHGEGVRSVSPE